MHTYQNFSYTVRSGHFELYITCLLEITNLVFALNHVNYAQWLVKYYDNLIKFSHTHAEVYKDFENGWFGVKRIAKSFSSTPIDVTLEQTINTDAASQRLGISLITNFTSAGERWTESYFLRTTILFSLLGTLNLKRKDDISQYLKYVALVKDNTLLFKVIGPICETIFPFTQNKGSAIINIATGKVAT